MATTRKTIEYLLEQLSELHTVTARKMFGEYALYYDGKVVGLVCDDVLYVKITDPGRLFVGTKFQEGYAYSGAKASMQIEGDLFEDREWLTTLVKITAEALPLPKTKKLHLQH